ncbi:MAG: hypothetical protein IPJ41_09755 [Phycisphaerales bacterium]|nr:hypothetical protein [Phycisphaerales bacterium]
MTPRPEAFLIAWFLPSWIVFELVGTKLPHYTMPLYPAVALMTARGLLAWPSVGPERRKRARLGSLCWLAVGLALFAVVGLGLMLGIEGPRAWLGLPLLGGALLALGPTVLAIRREDLIRAQGWSLLAGWGLLVAFLLSVAPHFFGLTSYAAGRAQALAPDRPVTWVGFNEDSVVWLARGRPSFTPPDQLASWFNANPDGVAIISVEAEDSYLSMPDLRAVEYASGMHYAKGRLEKLALVERSPE